MFLFKDIYVNGGATPELEWAVSDNPATKKKN